MKGWWVVLRAATGAEDHSSVMNRGGNMKFLLRTLLLGSLCNLSSWSVSSGTLIVTQSPDVSLQEGETENITCCWKGTNERVGIKWLKNQTLIKHKTVINQSTGSQNEQKNYCSVLTIETAKMNYSGKYICKVSVEIPVLIEVEGNGTTVTVRARKNINASKGGNSTTSSENSKNPVIIAVAVVVPLFLITVICFCSLRKKEGRAARVIYEVPHTDSIGPETDIHSTSSSRDSTQWCEVPMYDYFERVETLPSK